MIDWIVAIFLLIGSGFMLLASIGIIRLPDTYTRLSASTKSATLGIIFIMTAVSIHFQSYDVVMESILVILFVFFTAPLSSHLIGRAAYHNKVPLSEHTVVDELKQEKEQSKRSSA